MKIKFLLLALFVVFAAAVSAQEFFIGTKPAGSKSTVRTTAPKVPSHEALLRASGYRVPTPKAAMRATSPKVPTPKALLRASGYRVHTPKAAIKTTAPKVLTPKAAVRTTAPRRELRIF